MQILSSYHDILIKPHSALIGFLVYFIVGGILMYFMKGARGVEIIPHYTFWKNFPFLIIVSVIKLLFFLYDAS